MIENLKIVRNILLKCFIIGFVMMLFALLVYVFNQDFVTGAWNSIYSLDEDKITEIIVLSFATFKSIVFLFFLVPALAIHWTIKVLEKKAA